MSEPFPRATGAGFVMPDRIRTLPQGVLGAAVFGATVYVLWKGTLAILAWRHLRFDPDRLASEMVSFGGTGLILAVAVFGLLAMGWICRALIATPRESNRIEAQPATQPKKGWLWWTAASGVGGVAFGLIAFVLGGLPILVLQAGGANGNDILRASKAADDLSSYSKPASLIYIAVMVALSILAQRRKAARSRHPRV